MPGKSNGALRRSSSTAGCLTRQATELEPYGNPGKSAVPSRNSSAQGVTPSQAPWDGNLADYRERVTQMSQMTGLPKETRCAAFIVKRGRSFPRKPHQGVKRLRVMVLRYR